MEGKFEANGNTINSIKHGLFILKNKKGDTIYLQMFNMDEFLYEIDFKSKDTLIITKGLKSYLFNKMSNKNKLASINILNAKIRDYEGLYFDSTGHINKLNSDLSFLTKSDTLRLSRDYPDWETQVREWKYGKTTP